MFFIQNPYEYVNWKLVLLNVHVLLGYFAKQKSYIYFDWRNEKYLVSKNVVSNELIYHFKCNYGVSDAPNAFSEASYVVHISTWLALPSLLVLQSVPSNPMSPINSILVSCFCFSNSTPTHVLYSLSNDTSPSTYSFDIHHMSSFTSTSIYSVCFYLHVFFLP